MTTILFKSALIIGTTLALLSFEIVDKSVQTTDFKTVKNPATQTGPTNLDFEK